ncbi:hypothetical protein HYX00_01020, partial [Candidatus Woesearchaeota archaeon]|nr:hypothetical protein [Candidatus Woesearchaeota archaeon]
SYFVTNLSISGHATIGNGTSTIEISTQLFNFSSTTGNLNINGTVTAKSFVGDGSLLTGLAGSPFNASGTNVYLNDSTANLGLGMSNPSDRLVVIGNVRISGSLNASSINTTGGAYFAINTGRVGIGTTSPTEILTVIGNANISGYLNISGDLIVNKQFNVSASTGNVNVAGTLDANNLKIQGSSLGDRFTNYSLVNFTSNLNSVNASISLWNVSGSNIYPREISGKVGVNTTSPAQTLTVQGTLNVTGNSTGVGDLFVTSLGRIGIGTSNPTKRLSINGTLDAITFDPSASPNPVINTTGNNLTISSASGSVIIRLG